MSHPRKKRMMSSAKSLLIALRRVACGAPAPGGSLCHPPDSSSHPPCGNVTAADLRYYHT